MSNLTGIYTGVVEDVDDALKKKRIRVRVFGVFEEPIEVEHIPWASPVFSDCRLPQVGEIVYVMFRGGQWENPVYLCKNDFELDDAKQERDNKIDDAMAVIKSSTDGVQIAAAGLTVEMSARPDVTVEDMSFEQDNTVCDKDVVSQSVLAGNYLLVGLVITGDRVTNNVVVKLARNGRYSE